MMSQPQKHLKITLIGESCRDIYRFGDVNRLSPEAPIPILDFEFEQINLGMAENVANNLRTLGVDVVLHTILMEDKIRFVDRRSNKQIMREDIKTADIEPIRVDEVDLDADCIIISDYDKGFVAYDFIQELRESYSGPMYIDTKKRDLEKFDGIVIKINEHEYNNRTSNGEMMLITYGGDAVVFGDQTFRPPKVELTDPCGAGDTFLAAFVYASFKSWTLEEQMRFAMEAAAITVSQIGVYAPSLVEIP